MLYPKLSKLLLFTLALPSILLFGCTDEPLSDCESGIRIGYRYVLNKHDVNLFGSDVTGMAIYVFDSTGILRSAVGESGDHLTNDWQCALQLPAGRYTIVSWGGDLSTYKVADMDNPATHSYTEGLTIGSTRIENFRMMIQYRAGDITELEPVGELNELYFGREAQVEIRNGNYIDEVIDMIKNTNTITVTVGGLNNLRTRASANTAMDIYCTAYNGRYKYDNTIGEYARSLKYTPHYTTEGEDTMYVEMRVLRLMADTHQARATRLVIRELENTRATLYDRDVVNEILKLRNPLTGEYLYNTQTDLDREDTFDFRLTINRDLSVSVKINGWDVQTIYPDIY